MAGPFSVQSATREVAKNTQLEQFAVGGFREEALRGWLGVQRQALCVARHSKHAVWQNNMFSINAFEVFSPVRSSVILKWCDSLTRAMSSVCSALECSQISTVTDSISRPDPTGLNFPTRSTALWLLFLEPCDVTSAILDIALLIDLESTHRPDTRFKPIGLTDRFD